MIKLVDGNKCGAAYNDVKPKGKSFLKLRYRYATDAIIAASFLGGHHSFVRI